jgi:hypothetical protein
MRTVSVLPAANGWIVQSDEIENPMVFEAGGRAEVAARRLAQALATRGEPVEIRIHLKTGDLAGRLLCPANAPDNPPEVMQADFRLSVRRLD